MTAVVPRGSFPHVRVAGGFAFVSGTSARQPDNSIAGASVDELGTASLDIRAQTRAVLDNVQQVLGGVGADLADLVSATAYLVSINDFGGYNQVWGEYFGDAAAAPARTTVAVHQLPHPHLLVEIQAVALIPGKEST